MRAIILAAGEGTRLQPYTNNKPKCMVNLAGKPLLHRQIEVLRSINLEKSIDAYHLYMKNKKIRQEKRKN